MKPMRVALIGCGGCAGAVVGLVLLAVVVLAVGFETGYLPDDRALARGRIPHRALSVMREHGIIDPQEEVLYYYSDGLFSYLEDGNLFTPERVITYQTTDDHLSVYSATYPEIESIEFEPSEDWYENSVITVTCTDGDWLILVVSRTNGGDRRFHQQLRERWQRERDRPAPEPAADPASPR
jgi:hypothetical protein